MSFMRHFVYSFQFFISFLFISIWSESSMLICWPNTTHHHSFSVLKLLIFFLLISLRLLHFLHFNESKVVVTREWARKCYLNGQRWLEIIAMNRTSYTNRLFVFKYFFFFSVSFFSFTIAFRMLMMLASGCWLLLVTAGCLLFRYYYYFVFSTFDGLFMLLVTCVFGFSITYRV